MTRIAIIELDCEGQPLDTLVLPGNRLAWPMHHLGRALGFGPSGRGLLPKVRHEWRDDFLLDLDYLVLRDDEIEAIKDGRDPERQVVPDNARRLSVMLGAGLRQLLHRCEPEQAKAVGRFLQRQFATARGLPELDLDEIGATPTPAPRTSALSRATGNSALKNAIDKIQHLTTKAKRSGLVSREQRLMHQSRTREAEHQLEDRRFQVGMIRHLIEVMDDRAWLDSETRLALEIEACAIATGNRVVLLGARDHHQVPVGGLDDPTGSRSREQQQLRAMLGGEGCPLVLAWEPDGRMGAFRFFPKLDEHDGSPLSQRAELS